MSITSQSRVLLGVHLPASDAQIVRQRAAKADRSVSAELRVALRHYLSPRDGDKVSKTVAKVRR
jgi:hypothetical protein